MITVAKCGCSFEIHHAIPPQHPCNEAMKLIDEMPEAEFWQVRRYMEHMKVALDTIKEIEQ